jgi:hypothetical protein
LMILRRLQRNCAVPITSARGCYELAQKWIANAEKRVPTVSGAHRGIRRIPMRFLGQVHDTL